jgi:hypothetical protein
MNWKTGGLGVLFLVYGVTYWLWGARDYRRWKRLAASEPFRSAEPPTAQPVWNESDRQSGLRVMASSAIFLLLGVVFLIWGLVSDA